MKHAALTSRGRAVFDAARARRLRVAERVVGVLDADQREPLAPILETLIGTVDAARKP